MKLVCVFSHNNSTDSHPQYLVFKRRRKTTTFFTQIAMSQQTSFLWLKDHRNWHFCGWYILVVKLFFGFFQVLLDILLHASRLIFGQIFLGFKKSTTRRAAQATCNLLVKLFLLSTQSSSSCAGGDCCYKNAFIFKPGFKKVEFLFINICIRL